MESLFGAIRDEIPDSGVGHMDGTKQISRWVKRWSVYSPQERVEVTLL